MRFYFYDVNIRGYFVARLRCCEATLFEATLFEATLFEATLFKATLWQGYYDWGYFVPTILIIIFSVFQT